ncbi:RES domain-containing protein [Mycolicibacterium fluoranthenivorans]|uniref:RES domain-containing protein n=1 Tax=Mycolicibacterium fluoranthenivorans TaxID=258505 RepID=A0A1G4W1E6_9MYCO|nr:RES domain-containing protein [Mycolicibacterium fluoranthenivorans]SCX15217.1 RES domain-containing protein [Mycolicibacterium fluoranthenivorans]
MICPELPGEPNYADIEAVCLDCIGRPLHEEASELLTLDTCSFCESTGDSISMDFDEFMELIKTGLFYLYDIGSEVGNPPTGGGDGRIWLDYSEVASEHCWEAVGGTDIDTRYALFKAIENSLGDTDPWWTYADNGFPRLTLRYGWDEFRRSVTESDFESHWVLNPAEFVGQLQQILTWIPGILVTLPTDTVLWRARPFEGTAPPFEISATTLGSAPAQYAKSNRMSAEGVSMFYGAEQLNTALEEVKYGASTAAAAGQFRTSEPLLVVDLTAVNYEPSIFNAGERDDYYAARFLAGFAFDISRPASDPNRDYLPTQAITAGIKETPWEKIDGIRFRSAVDPDGINYVLFCTNDDCGESDADFAILRLDAATVIPHIPLK